MQQYIEITIGSRKLAACFHGAVQPGARPVVICCHGLTGTRVGSSYRLVTLARRLQDSGIACLRFDFRGCGESEGRFQDVTTQTLLEDLSAVIAEVKRLPGVDASRVGIVGSSFGAYTASRVSDRIACLRCCVYLAPVADPHALIERDMSPEAWALLRKQGWLEHHGQRLGAGFFDTLPRDDVPAQLARTGRPLLIYHGRDDRQVPLEQGRAYESAMQRAGATVELHAIETSDHGMRGVTHTEMIIAGAAAWLTGYL